VAAGTIILASVWLITGSKKQEQPALMPCRGLESKAALANKQVCQTHEFASSGTKRSA
jgi:hypothetical protein